MDANGFFNLSITGVGTAAAIKTSKHIVLEIHDTIPHVCGPEQYVHITDVDYVVEVADSKLPVYLPNIEPTEIDKKIAMNIMPLITDGSCLQLGVGGTPNYVGKMIAESDLKDFGIHTELLASAYFDMFKAGKITNAKKALNKGTSICTFVLGSKELYQFIDHNPLIQLYPSDYTNNPFNIMQNDNVISICGCIHIDILGQVSAESVGRKQVSGTGGQVDYHYSAYHSKGGKGIICVQSARFDQKSGKIRFQYSTGAHPRHRRNDPKFSHQLCSHGIRFGKFKRQIDMGKSRSVNIGCAPRMSGSEGWSKSAKKPIFGGAVTNANSFRNKM